MRGRIETLTVDSQALVGNALGDPTRRDTTIWLPPAYDEVPHRRFPVIYWLAGFTGTGPALFHDSPWQPGLGRRLDELAAAQLMGDVIVVAPDCFTRFGGSQYVDSPATGRYETHVCRELIPAVDRAYRTVADRAGRGIGGKSSGGFGALVLAMRQPDLFAAVASHAGDAYFEVSVLGMLPIVVRTLGRCGGIDGFLDQFDRKPTKTSDDIDTITMIAMCAAYLPDAAQPHGFSLPFDAHTGELSLPAWRLFKAWDPIDMVNPHAASLRRMRLVYLDAGTRDEWGLDLGARILAQRLRRLGVAVEHEEFDGGHRNTSHRFAVSIPKIAAALGAPAGRDAPPDPAAP